MNGALDCMLSLDSALIVDNSALQVSFYSILIYLKVTKIATFLAKEIHAQILNSMWDSRLSNVPQRFVGTNF